MKARNIVIAAAAGIAAGYVVKQQLDRNQSVTPEKALKKAKETFKKQGPISGSWIYMKPEEYEKKWPAVPCLPRWCHTKYGR